MLILLYLLWILLNGRFTADAGMLQICITGIPVALLAYIISRRFLGITPQKELKFWKKLPLLVLYVLVLVKEIIIASIRMSGVILSRKETAAPVIIRVKITLKSEFCKVILANSITLTPGTITADFEDDVFVIHCINESFAEGIEECSFVKILERVEK